MSELRSAVVALSPDTSKEEDERIRIASEYYVAFIDDVLFVRAKSEGHVDHNLAGSAIKNFRSVIQYGNDIPEWAVSISNAYYFAGNTIFELDGPTDEALRYWTQCARMGVGGCANNLGVQLIEKPGLAEKDIRSALDIHTNVVKTGTRSRCAGIYSADEIAKINHFLNVRRPGDNEIDWAEEGQALAREIRKTETVKDPCSGAGLGVLEFMMLRDRGKTDDTLLTESETASAGDVWRPIVQYLQGRLDDVQLIAATSGSSYDQCRGHFYAAWKNKQSGQIQLARAHYEAMKNLTDTSCRLLRIYAGKMLQ